MNAFSNTYHIIYGFNDGFCQYAATSISSLLYSNPYLNFHFHLFHINCSHENLEKLRFFLNTNGCKFNLYEFSPQSFSKYPPTSQYSLACYLRLSAPSLMPGVSKALYLDSDTIIVGDIRDLLETDVIGYALAACRDSSFSYNIVKSYLSPEILEEYFNSGVLLINLKWWKENDSEEQLIEYLNTHKVKLPDQDALNAIFGGHDIVKILHPKWNALASYFCFPPQVPNSEKKFIKDLWKNARIIHFIGTIKPWHKECVNPFKNAFIQAYNSTPWGPIQMTETITNPIKSNLVKIIRILKMELAKISSAFSI